MESVWFLETKPDIDPEFIRMALEELERCKSKDDQVNACYRSLEKGDGPDANESTKKEVIKLLLTTSNTSRLYFIVRSMIMSLINGIIFLFAVIVLQSIGPLQAIIIGIASFVISLLLSRLLDRQVNRVTHRVIRILNRHPHARRVIINNL
jgi:hypothetical protein